MPGPDFPLRALETSLQLPPRALLFSVSCGPHTPPTVWAQWVSSFLRTSSSFLVPVLEMWLCHLPICLRQNPRSHPQVFLALTPTSHQAPGPVNVTSYISSESTPSLHPHHSLTSLSHHHLRDEVKSKNLPLPILLQFSPFQSILRPIAKVRFYFYFVF